MAQTQRTGGSENLRGIHYQLLRSLFQANRILDLKLEESDEPQWSKLVIEPRDGGDLQLEASDVIDVEQMKVRSVGPWPLYDVIHEVLPDLYKAFADRSPHRPIREASVVGPIFGNICYPHLVWNTARREDEGSGSDSSFGRGEGRA